MSELGSSPSNWPVITISDPIDIYGECLYYYYTVNHPNDFPIRLLILLMAYRPFIYYTISLTRTYSEQEEFDHLILSEIPNVFGEPLPDIAVRLKDVISLNFTTIDNLSAITYFHYLIGFTFNKDYISITRSDISSIIPQYDALIKLNISYNFSTQAITTYKPFNIQIGAKLLTTEVTKAFKPITTTALPDTYPQEYATVEGTIGSNNYCVLNYDDTHYTLLTDASLKPFVFTSEQANRIIEGALPDQLTLSTYLTLAEQQYYTQLDQLIVSSAPPTSKIITFDDIYKSIQSCIPNSKSISKSKFTSILTSITSAISSIRKFDSTDKKLFNFYLSCYPSDTYSKTDFISYIRAYFEPDE